jgi:hypothetical protein
MNIKAFFARVVNDCHVPIAIAVFASTSAYHFLKHVDLGANYTNSIYALYGFLGAHNLTNQKYPDQPDGQPPAGGTNGQ